MHEIDFHRALFRPGVIIDAGGHEGRLTLPLSELPGARVIAFEPLPTAHARLREAIAGRAVEVRPEALSDHLGTLTLSVPRVGGVAQEEWGSITKDYASIRRDDPRVDGIDQWDVPVITLDSLGLANVTAIKIDVEGAEAEVLAGARETIQRCRPILSIEIEERHRPGAMRAVPALLRGWGYHGFFEFWGDWRPIETLDVATMQRGSPSPAAFEVSDPYVFNFYFVQDDRVPDLARLARPPSNQAAT